MKTLSLLVLTLLIFPTTVLAGQPPSKPWVVGVEITKEGEGGSVTYQGEIDIKKRAQALAEGGFQVAKGAVIYSVTRPSKWVENGTGAQQTQETAQKFLKFEKEMCTAGIGSASCQPHGRSARRLQTVQLEDDVKVLYHPSGATDIKLGKETYTSLMPGQSVMIETSGSGHSTRLRVVLNDGRSEYLINGKSGSLKEPMPKRATPAKVAQLDSHEIHRILKNKGVFIDTPDVKTQKTTLQLSDRGEVGARPQIRGGKLLRGIGVAGSLVGLAYVLNGTYRAVSGEPTGTYFPEIAWTGRTLKSLSGASPSKADADQIQIQKAMSEAGVK